MIWYYLITFFGSLLTAIFSWLPKVTELPFGADAIMLNVFGYWRGFLEIAWPLDIVWSLFLWYLSIKVGLMVLRFFLGHRAPFHTI